MSSELRRWLADRFPEGMTSGDRLVLLELADWAHNDTRAAYGDTLLPTLTRRTGLSERQIAKILAKVATQYGVDFRVPVKNADGTVKTDVLGRVVYAHKGHQTTYRIPERLSWETPIESVKAVPADRNGCPVGPQRLNHRTTKDVPQDTPTPEAPLNDLRNTPGSSIASLSPSVPRGNRETREDRIIRLMQTHAATYEEITGTWKMVSDPDREGGHWKHFGPWSDSDDEDIAEELAEYRQGQAYAAAYAAWQPMPECGDCGRPMRGAGGPLCVDCR